MSHESSTLRFATSGVFHREHGVNELTTDCIFGVKQNPKAPWALAVSGGGLRSTAASAVFTLALMKSKALNPNKLTPASATSSATNQSQQSVSAPERVWDLISRAFGVSGGAWMLIALSNGVLHELNSSWSIDQLVEHLHKTGIIRDGDFDARTKEIHDKLLPKLGEVATGWHPVCCWCPAVCCCFQGLIDCVYNCCCCRPPYLLATALNESAGEAGLCAVKDDPLAALEKFLIPILFGKQNKKTDHKRRSLDSDDDDDDDEENDANQKIYFDHETEKVESTNTRKRRGVLEFERQKDKDAAAANNQIIEGSPRDLHYHDPEIWVSAVTEPRDIHKESQYFWCHYRINHNKPALVVQNPPPLFEESCNLNLQKPLKLADIAAFCGSAFSTDARAFAEHSGLRLIQDIVKAFPFSTKAIMGGETVRKVELKKQQPPPLPRQEQQSTSATAASATTTQENVGGEQQQEESTGKIEKGTMELPNPADMRDAGVDVNIAFLALNGYQAAWVLDNGTESEMGKQLLLATLRGHIGHYDQVAVDMVKGWGIYCRNSTGERGPAIIIYVMGMNDVPLMNVRRAQERKMRAKSLYDKWMEEIPKIIEVLEKIIVPDDVVVVVEHHATPGAEQHV